MSLPLEGVRVFDLTRLLPGNYCTLLLADLGADVVKIEEPGRGDSIRQAPPVVDGQGAVHRALNRGKRSVALDLGGPRGSGPARRRVDTRRVGVVGGGPVLPVPGDRRGPGSWSHAAPAAWPATGRTDARTADSSPWARWSPGSGERCARRWGWMT